VTRFLPLRLSLAQAGAQTAACGDATLSQHEKTTRQMSGNTFSSTEAVANHHLLKCTANGTVIDDAPLKKADSGTDGRFLL
jgi:hypothetical protein